MLAPANPTAGRGSQAGVGILVRVDRVSLGPAVITALAGGTGELDAFAGPGPEVVGSPPRHASFVSASSVGTMTPGQSYSAAFGDGAWAAWVVVRVPVCPCMSVWDTCRFVCRACACGLSRLGCGCIAMLWLSTTMS